MNRELVQILYSIRTLENHEGGCFLDLVRPPNVNCLNIRCGNCPCAIEDEEDSLHKQYGYEIVRIPLGVI